MENVRLVIAGISLYIIPSLFHRLHAKWWPNDVAGKQLDKSIQVMRCRFWRSFLLVALTVGVTLAVLLLTGLLRHLDCSYSLRSLAVVVALTATLGRGGWEIQTWHGKTVCERIDRGMYVISQLGATSILLCALTL